MKSKLLSAILAVFLAPFLLYGATTIYQGGNVTEIINPSSSGTHELKTGGAGIKLTGGKFDFNPSVTGAVGLSFSGIQVTATLTEAASGVHGLNAGTNFSTTIVDGGGTTTEFANVNITELVAPAGTVNAAGLQVGAASGATNNRAIWVRNGLVELAQGQLQLSDTFTPSAGNSRSLFMTNTLNTLAGSSAFNADITPTIAEAGSGTHPALIAMRILPTFTSGGASTTVAGGLDLPTWAAPSGTTSAIGLRIAAPTGASTNNNAAYIASGTVRIEDLKSATGVRYVCVDTAGVMVSQAAACSGT